MMMSSYFSSAMHQRLASRAENWVDFLRREVDLSSPPADLFSIARLRRIGFLGLRLMVPRGMLLPVAGGYEVYIRSSASRDIDISFNEKEGELTPRQRFTLAHEIAHTLYFHSSNTVPVPDPSISNELLLEDICNRTAGQILIPTHLLKREISGHSSIDPTLVLSIARACFINRFGLTIDTYL